MTGWERTIEERGGERRGDWCTAGEETWPCHEYIENYGNHRELDNLIMRREMTIARCNSKLRKMMAGGGWFRRASISRKWKLGGGRGEEEDEENLATTRNFSISQPLNMIFFFFFINIWDFFFLFFGRTNFRRSDEISLTNPYTVRSRQSYAIQSLLIINSKLLGQLDA